VSAFDLHGKTYGGRFFADGMAENFIFDAWPGIKSIIELGSCEGARTRFLAAKADSVTCVEGRESNIRKARLIKELYSMRNVHLVHADVEQDPITSLGEFDAAYVCGILYHLRKPWQLLDKLTKMTARIAIWTHYCKDEDVTSEVDGFRGCIYQEQGLDDPLSGLSPTSFWMTKDGILDKLSKLGYLVCSVIDELHPNGAAVTMYARRVIPYSEK